MTNSTDQERKAFEAWFDEYSLSVRMNGGYMNDAQMFDAWQARAQLQPASVTVPDAMRDVIYNTLRNYRMGTLDDGEGCGYPLIDAMSADGQTVAGGIEECGYLADALVDALAASPHPVSGEHNPITAPYLMYCLGSWWPCEERQVNAAVDRNYPLINLRGLPAAQDVADPIPGLRLALDLLTEDGQGFMQKRVIVDKLIELGVTLPPDQLL